jgi:hypothetical protein
MADALLETYKCKKCGTKTSAFIERSDETGLFYYERKVGDKIHEDDVPTHDGTSEESYCPDWAGDSTYWYKYETVWSMDYFNTIECPCCGAETGKRASIMYFSVGESRNSYRSLKERMRYAHEGMDKKQAEKFYKESIDATRERVKTGDQHYKKVVPNYQVLEKEGVVRRRKDDSNQQAQGLKDMNRALTKDGTLGKGNFKK